MLTKIVCYLVHETQRYVFSQSWGCTDLTTFAGIPNSVTTLYEGVSHENLKLRVASGAAIFTLLLRRRVAFPHRTATYRPLFKPCCQLTDKRAVFRIFIAL